MAASGILFNGIKMSYAVIDQAIAWAKQSNGSLIAVFLSAEKETTEGYIFPSDLDAAENLADEKDGTDRLQNIIESNARTMQRMANTEHIEIKTVFLTDATEDKLNTLFEGCDKIFCSDEISSIGTMTQENMNLEKWLSGAKITVQQIKE